MQNGLIGILQGRIKYFRALFAKNGVCFKKSYGSIYARFQVVRSKLMAIQPKTIAKILDKQKMLA